MPQQTHSFPKTKAVNGARCRADASSAASETRVEASLSRERDVTPVISPPSPYTRSIVLSLYRAKRYYAPIMNRWLLALTVGVASFVAGWSTHTPGKSPLTVIPAAVHSGPRESESISHSEQLPPPPTRPDDIQEFKRAFAGAITDSSPRTQLRDLLALLDELTPEKAAAVLPIIGKLPMRGMSDNVCVFLFLSRWGELDPEGALKRIKESKDRNEGLSPSATESFAVLDGWASKDLSGLIRYADQKEPHSSERKRAVLGVVYALDRRDLDAAGKFLLSQPDIDDPNLQEARQELMFRAQDRDRLDLAIAWFERAPEGTTKRFIASYTSEFLEKKHPAAGAEFKARPDVQEALKAK
jgi:hypothetical protein